MLEMEERIFSRLKYPITAKLKTEYPNIFFTASDRVQSEPKFPTVYVHLMSVSELGRDMSGTTINGGLFSFQIEVIDNISQARAKDVMNEVVAQMKTMRFEMIAFPINENTNDTYRVIARFRRPIGSLDIL